MKSILVYDTTEEILERLSDQRDVPVAELLDIFFPDEEEMEEMLKEQGL